MDGDEQFYLPVGTEVSAKYRGAFCEAKIKSVKKSVLFRISNKKDGKIYNIAEDSIKGTKKIGSTVDVQLGDAQGWNEGVVLGAKDKSTYTVEFDDGDVRTLSRGSLCLQGVRHFAEGDTLDQLPLTDPENFGTPVLNSKRKAKRKVTQASSLDNEEVESDDQKLIEIESTAKRKSLSRSEVKEESEEEAVEEKRRRWLAHPLMGKLVLVEPTDKRKHWYPAVCVNPLAIEEYDELEGEQMVVRSFKNGRLLVVGKCERLTRSNSPSKVEAQWKDVLESAFLWQENATVPDVWKSELPDEEDEEENSQVDDENAEKRQEFSEQLYKFMEDRGTPITKRPVLGYKDLDLYLLYNLAQEKGGFFAINNSSDWKEIYTDLGIPKMTPAASHHAKMAYSKYLLCFEEYVSSFQQNKHRESITKSPSKKTTKIIPSAKSPRSVDDTETTGRRSSRRRKISESLSVAEDYDSSLSVKEPKRSRKSKLATETKRDSDADEVSSTASSEKSSSRSKAKVEASSPKPEARPELKQIGRTRSNSGSAALRKHAVYKIGDKLRVKYGRDSFKLYTAKVVDLKTDANNEVQYYVHYTGWNSRHDEWIKQWKISGLFSETSFAKTPVRRPKTPTPSDDKNEEEDSNVSSTQETASTSAETQSASLPPTPTAPLIADEEALSLAKTFQDESKKISEKRRRIRRRSTSSSTPPPHPPSTKRASSVEKFLPGESEPKTPPKQDSGDEKSSEKASPSTAGVPTGLFPAARRTSGRRSKSPAYLRESALYGLTKRKRNNSAVSEAQSNADPDQPQLDAEDLSSESSSKSFTSSANDANRSSPLTLWTAETEPNRSAEKSKKPERRRTRRKSGDRKLSLVSEESKGSLLKRSAAYDIFDDDVPNIELERSSGDMARKSKTSKKRKISSDKQEPEVTGEEPSREGQDSNQNPVKFPEKSPPVATSPDEPSNSSPKQISPQEVAAEANEQEPESNGSSPRSSERSANSDENESNNGSVGSSESGESPSNRSNNDNEMDVAETKDEENIKDLDKPEDKKLADSESEAEEAKNKLKKRKKPKKKKTRPAPPKAPSPLKQEDLASMAPDDRINTMMDRLEELRRLYHLLKQEVSWIDRKRKRAKRREQEAAEQSAKKTALQSPSKQSDQPGEAKNANNTAS